MYFPLSQACITQNCATPATEYVLTGSNFAAFGGYGTIPDALERVVKITLDTSGAQLFLAWGLNQLALNAAGIVLYASSVGDATQAYDGIILPLDANWTNPAFNFRMYANVTGLARFSLGYIT